MKKRKARRREPSKGGRVPAFETLASTGAQAHEAGSGVQIPSAQNIKDAKDWVDEKEM
ncbi:MAG: DUF3787 domain-containing protein [Christensenellaceae bacterium]|jgi:hypothetical protein|nr:DUF3787 domain-containing protein [Christensenellaceae bacterium]